MSSDVISSFHRVIAFARWVFAPEELPESPADVRGAGLQREGLSQGMLERGTVRGIGGCRPGGGGFLRLLLSGEALDPPVAPPAVSSNDGATRWLLSPDTLPTLPEDGLRAPSGQGLLHHILSPETCPVLPAAPQRRTPDMARWLLAAEECPEVDAPRPQRRVGVLSGIVTPEVCPTEAERSTRRGTGFVRWILSSQDCPQGGSPALRRRRSFTRWLFSQEKL